MKTTTAKIAKETNPPQTSPPHPVPFGQFSQFHFKMKFKMFCKVVSCFPVSCLSRNSNAWCGLPPLCQALRHDRATRTQLSDRTPYWNTFFSLPVSRAAFTGQFVTLYMLFSWRGVSGLDHNKPVELQDFTAPGTSTPILDAHQLPGYFSSVVQQTTCIFKDQGLCRHN